MALLTACGDGQPFVFDEDAVAQPGDDAGDPPEDAFDDEEPPADDEGFEGDLDVPPGTASPSPDASIRRFEPLNETGGGFVRSVSYNAAEESFTVDNLAFDGITPYRRDSGLPSMGGYAVFESDETVRDPVNGDEIGQLDYRAIYGVSRNSTTVDGERMPVSRFAIVRSGDFVDYGFGGFLYERNGGVELPERRDGQAVFIGDYAGTRVFSGRGGQELTEAGCRSRWISPISTSPRASTGCSMTAAPMMSTAVRRSMPLKAACGGRRPMASCSTCRPRASPSPPARPPPMARSWATSAAASWWTAPSRITRAAAITASSAAISTPAARWSACSS
jgi:hypothetical protein